MTPMTDRRRTIRSTTIASGLFAGILTGLAVIYALVALPLHQPLALQQPLASAEADIGESASASVHAKNRATPGWMLDLQARNAFERPVTQYGDKPGFWI
jgi:hypothetical protein